MAAGLDTAAGIAGLISLSVTALQGCVKGFQMIATARLMRQDQERIRSIIEWEQYRLIEWAHRARLDVRESCDHSFNWAMAADLLKQLERLLTDTEHLRAEYGLVAEDERRLDVLESLPKPKVGIAKLWNHAKPELRALRARIVQETSNTFKKLKWVTFDYDKISDLLRQTGFFNDCLYELLQSQERQLIGNALSVLLRDLVSHTPVSEELEVFRPMLASSHVKEHTAIDAATNLKKLRLLLKVDQVPAERVGSDKKLDSALSQKASIPKPMLSKLSFSSLNISSNSGPPSEGARQLGTYKSSSKAKIAGLNAHVLIEWKAIPKHLESRLKQRIHELTILMSSISDPSFHCLKCLGFLVKETEGDNVMYAYIFEVVDLNIQDSLLSTPPQMKSLHSWLQESDFPSLSLRMDIAYAIAQTVLQLHTSGWLHKGIQSEIVLFFDDCDDRSQKTKYRGPYIAGFEHSRVDNPLEITEDVPQSPEHNIYRHPETLLTPRPPFKKLFDLFGLGCILLELAFWKPLSRVLLDIEAGNENVDLQSLSRVSNSNEKDHIRWKAITKGKERLLDKEKIEPIMQHVAFHAGDDYVAAVELCFFPAMATVLEGEEDEEESEASLLAQEAVVQALSRDSH